MWLSLGALLGSFSVQAPSAVCSPWVQFWFMFGAPLGYLRCTGSTLAAHLRFTLDLPLVRHWVHLWFVSGHLRVACVWLAVYCWFVFLLIVVVAFWFCKVWQGINKVSPGGLRWSWLVVGVAFPSMGRHPEPDDSYARLWDGRSRSGRKRIVFFYVLFDLWCFLVFMLVLL